MSKLAAQDKFLDLSDYGRPFGKFLANQLKNTRFTPIHVTLLFGVSGLIAIYCILQNHYFLAGFFIILKSIIDAADGELARIKNTPSYTGRYLDSVFDIVLNFLLFMAIYYVSKTTIWLTILAFIGIQLQGTLYNYYYVILRNKSVGGDSTSKVFECKSPKALPGESQKSVDILFRIYTIVYGTFDKIIHTLDKEAYKIKTFPNWFMTLVSIYGLGFQLLIIAVMLPMGLIEYIAPFFIIYTLFIFVLIGIRKAVFKV
ncbi:CDP-alcohol phosphatidyltransferase family protein [Flavobacterium gawalongense]|uniref:CDP-alcohol phosphatidyltransferase family protein n=1 Tax=Flavobacterium gawalongense TaxID=2594432 RepID=A0A553BV39_9FLAO|nr:CDP-alcohol phosphatidyltransferase family protein [Flavobacterium gawalongense]TRX02784.1 CDP-alcohol phosphatidyltransferase family protein [Flavobacterium gawalongense]TRX08092.1 CDP-alcohol phosphatidyltransferase family protein [Flavobacterium gawalongense]TRX11370.1 CDP-alcohol phosphatidyltransferase family protein [Flavobacterium gawalongense]TRX12118.1 CDP-alcohol phosphatidyltransferase family protein [Flavobacterium gawalongense]TRX29005.1 CDP-alcohol phosphatidyltransferase fami